MKTSKLRKAPNAVRELDRQAFRACGLDADIAENAPTPDVAIHFSLAGHGYEARVFINGFYTGAWVRDFDDTHKLSELRQSLITEIATAVNRWRLKL